MRVASAHCLCKQTAVHVIFRIVERKISLLLTSDQRCDAQLVDENVVRVLAAGEELRYDEEVGSNRSGAVHHVLRHMQRCAVTVVETDAVEDPRRSQCVLPHVLPQDGIRFRGVTVAKNSTTGNAFRSRSSKKSRFPVLIILSTEDISIDLFVLSTQRLSIVHRNY